MTNHQDGISSVKQNPESKVQNSQEDDSLCEECRSQPARVSGLCLFCENDDNGDKDE